MRILIYLFLLSSTLFADALNSRESHMGTLSAAKASSESNRSNLKAMRNISDRGESLPILLEGIKNEKADCDKKKSCESKKSCGTSGPKDCDKKKTCDVKKSSCSTKAKDCDKKKTCESKKSCGTSQPKDCDKKKSCDVKKSSCSTKAKDCDKKKTCELKKSCCSSKAKDCDKKKSCGLQVKECSQDNGPGAGACDAEKSKAPCASGGAWGKIKSWFKK